MAVCQVPGCGLAVSGFSNYCDSHKRHNRRHGHPAQSAITAKELEPFVARVRERIAKNSENPTWRLLRERWSTILSHAETQLARYLAGTPFNRYEIDAWHQINKIGESVQGADVIEVVLAMYLRQEENPYRFKSHEAFGGQLVRRVRALAPVNVGEYYDHKAGATKRVYRDAKPKTVGVIAEILHRTFGAAGLTVAKLEQRELATKQSEQRALHDALERLE